MLAHAFVTLTNILLNMLLICSYDIINYVLFFYIIRMKIKLVTRAT